MSLDSRLRLARKNGAGARLRDFEVPTMVDALQLLRACERAEATGPLPPPPFPAFLDRDLVEAELRATLDTGRQRIVDLGGDCDPVDRMLSDAMHSLDMRAQGATRDRDNPAAPAPAHARFRLWEGGGIDPGSVRMFVGDTELTPLDQVDQVRAEVAAAAAELERAVRALGGEA